MSLAQNEKMQSEAEPSESGDQTPSKNLTISRPHTITKALILSAEEEDALLKTDSEHSQGISLSEDTLLADSTDDEHVDLIQFNSITSDVMKEQTTATADISTDGKALDDSGKNSNMNASTDGNLSSQDDDSVQLINDSGVFDKQNDIVSVSVMTQASSSSIITVSSEATTEIITEEQSDLFNANNQEEFSMENFDQSLQEEILDEDLFFNKNEADSVIGDVQSANELNTNEVALNATMGMPAEQIDDQNEKEIISQQNNTEVDIAGANVETIEQIESSSSSFADCSQPIFDSDANMLNDMPNICSSQINDSENFDKSVNNAAENDQLEDGTVNAANQNDIDLGTNSNDDGDEKGNFTFIEFFFMLITL